MKKILLIMLCMIFLIGNISAFEFDNVAGNYDEETQTIEIRNSILGIPFLQLDKVAEIKLNTPTTNVLNKIGYQKIAELKSIHYEDYIDAFKKLEFYNKNENMKRIERVFDYKILVTEDYLVNDYGEVCSGEYGNGTKKCSWEIIGTHTRQREVWKPLEEDNFLKGEVITIGIFTHVYRYDNIEWIPTYYGVEIDEWASYVQSDGTQTFADYGGLNYTIITYTTNGTFNVTGDHLNLSVLIVAGGGAGQSGGGGAGGVIYNTSYLAIGFIDVRVGIGGTNGTAGSNIRYAQNSSFGSLIAFGGGIGGGVGSDGLQGGSGGGAGANKIAYSLGIVGQGHGGGTGAGPPYPAGGGGGAGVAGGNGTGDTSGSGGDGRQIDINGTNVYWAGGAGGGRYDGTITAGAGGSGGGGAGGLDGGAGTAGINGTGGGGGGAVNAAKSGGSGIVIVRYLTSDTTPTSTIILDAPVNYANFTTTNNLILNATIFDAINITNASLILDGVYNETNLTAGINNSIYTFNKSLSEGDHTWTMEACNFNNLCSNASSRTFNINTTPTIAYGAGVPIDSYNSTTNSFEINVTLTEDLFKNVTFDLYNRGGTINRTITYTNATRRIDWGNLIDGNYEYNVTTATTTNQFNNTATRNITIDATIPAVIMLAPPLIIDNHLINTNLSVNWSANDTNIDTCTLEYEGVNRTVTCGFNSTEINITNSINKSVILYVNDTFGHMNSTLRTWNYTIFENSQTFNDLVFEGTTETFTANITVEGIVAIANLFYDGTPYSGTFSQSGNDTILTIDFTIPSVGADVNITFIWNIQLSDSQSINLTSHNQTITSIGLDACSVNTVVLYNYTVVDEGNQSIINQTTIEINLNLLDVGRTEYIANFTNISIGINPFAICLNQEINSSIYSVDSIVKYQSDGYSIEYYNIVDSTITNVTVPINITLYDLALLDATEFKITFKDENFIFVENALVYIDRQYISENNSFKTVELPKTDSNGQTVGHFVRNDVVYNIRVIKDGEVLGNFENIIAFCTDYTIGDCQIVLEATPSDPITFDYDEELGIIFQSIPTHSNTTNLVSFSFSTDDGTPKTVLMDVTRSDIFGNRTICNSTITSSSGTLSCYVDPNIDDTVLITNVYVNGQLAVLGNVKLDASVYGNLGYVLWFILTFLFIFIFGKSKTEVLIGLFISLAGAITLGVTRGNIVGIGSAGIWALVIVILGIWKINKENPQ